MKKPPYAYLAIALLIGGTSLEAATISFDFSLGTNNSETAYGNVRTFTDSQTGITATLTSWGITNWDGSTWVGTSDPAHTTRYDVDLSSTSEKLALGICNQGERGGDLTQCKEGNTTQADNLGQYEYFLIQFDAGVKPVNIVVTPDKPFPPDSDPYNPILDVAYGDALLGSMSITPSTMTFAQVEGMFGGFLDISTPQGTGDKTILLPGRTSNTLFFGPKVTGFVTSGDDDINPDRIGLLTLTVETPEPTTLALLGLGLAGIGFARKRQQA